MRVFLNPQNREKRNPRTWSENLVEDDSPYSLYWLFRGMEFRDEQPEEAEEVLRQIIETNE